jgi:hypothetical protein
MTIKARREMAGLHASLTPIRSDTGLSMGTITAVRRNRFSVSGEST